MRKAIILSLITLFFLTNTVFAFTPSYQFTDQEKDNESGLYNYGSREYDPNIGKFLQQDPILKDGSLDSHFLNNASQKELNDFLSNPQNLNPYSYTRNNPVNYVDPKGEVAVPVILGVISALLFYDIPIAYAPTNENSTPPMVKTKDFGDSIQGYNKIPKVIRGGIPFILGFKNKIANKISNKLSKKTEKEFITLYHGTNNFTDIVKNGFKKTKLYFTPVAFDAERYSLGWSKIIEPFVFQFKLLKKEFNELYKIGKILPDPRDANAFYTKDGNLIKKINNLIKRDYVKK